MTVSKSNQKSISLMVIAVLLSAFSSIAQTSIEPPTPPTPPKTISVTTSSNSSHSIVVKNDDDQHSSSVSVSISDESYKFRARYNNSKNEGIKAILLEKLGKDNLKISGNTYLWTDPKGGDDVFECKLNKGSLKIYMNKESTSDSFQNKVVELGKDIKYYINGSSREKEEAKTAEQAKRELEKAEKELERAKQELKRAEREAKRAKGN